MKLSRQASAEILFVVTAPIIGFFALHISLINQDYFVDPWFYTGYGQEFKLFQELFGWTYYAVRFPVILLNLAVPKGWDPVVGFAVIRYLIFLSCGVPLYLWARHYFGVIYAIPAYLFLFCNPLFLRLLLWDLTPFVSVPMALAGIALWLMPTKSNAAMRILSGFAFGASVAAHPFTGTAIAAFFAVEAARRLIKREYLELALLDIAAPIAGAAICFAIGIACYYLIIGPFDPRELVDVTIAAIRGGDQYAASHSEGVSTWIWRETNVLVPLLLVEFMAIGFARELLKDNVVSRLWWFALVYCLLYSAYQFLFHRFVLEQFYYFFHLSVVVYLLFPVCLYLLAYKLKLRSQLIVIGIAIATLFLTSMYPTNFIIDPTSFEQAITSFKALSFIVGTGIIFAIYSIGRFTKVASIMSVYAVAVVFAVQTLALSAPAFSRVYSNTNEQYEYEVYRAAVEMVRVFASYTRPSERVMLWYPTEEYSIGSIASTVLLYSINKNSEGNGLPDLGDYERSRLGLPELKYVLMLSENRELIAKGKDVLMGDGYHLRDVEHRTVGGANFSAHLDLIELIK